MAPPRDASVLVGLVNRGEWIDHLLAALERQKTRYAHEVIVAERLGGDTAARLSREHPGVKVLSAPASATLPELRTLALEAASGRVVLVTEDHTVPPPDWIERLVGELDRAPARIAAAGGPVDNAMTGRAVDWAAFLIEYHGFLPPQASGEVEDVPGMNVAYRREALAARPREDLVRGFWESTVHPRLRAEGCAFLRLGDVVMMHRKRFGFFDFLAQRYHYSRYFGGVRFARAERARRVAYAVLAWSLPVVVAARLARAVWARPRYRGPLVRAAPAMACFLLALGPGESAGYLFGPGRSLRAIE